MPCEKPVVVYRATGEKKSVMAVVDSLFFFFLKIVLFSYAAAVYCVNWILC